MKRIEEFLNQIICGNCLEVMKEMPSESIDLVMFSPPYWGLRDYGEESVVEWPDGWKGQLGLEPHPQMYIDHLVMICREIKRILKKSGSMYINLGDTYYGGSGHASDEIRGKDGSEGVKKPVDSKRRALMSHRSNWLQPKLRCDKRTA